MDILYVSKLCSKKKFEEIFISCQIKPQQQAQKFHHLFVSGLAEHEDVQVTVMSDLPISRVNTKRIWWCSSSELENKTVFKHLPHLNMAVIGHIIAFFTAFFTTAKWCVTNKKSKKYIICDVLNLTISVAAKAAANLFGVNTVAIVTDIPSFMQGYTKEGEKGFKSAFIELYTSLCNYFLKRYNAYIILTEQMNRLVNPKGKPHIVIEGMVDVRMREVSNLLEDKYQEKVVIYAGALHEKYGVKKLIEAFMNVSLKDARLWLFGSGELESEIREYEKKDSRIKFWGMVPNKEVVEKEVKATLLVNPRPSNEEFTKYSFPSKNMEYMVSGTPILTTQLPGMPEEYYDFIFTFNGESVDDMAIGLEKVLTMPRDELHWFGDRAKKFVLENKNNVVQARKLYDFISTYVCKY
ncbi:glycosyltransferase [Desulfotomaculum nigrificans]|uniref:glycosyltransferase n=1 Tax=Desulfotomaculum nigrificans TaxID=1565 RepID=UPI0001FAEADD|nr:glycosyltransferase [Desulfotomaculum nigrificans]